MLKRGRLGRALCGAALLAATLALPVRAEGPTADTVVATVNGTDITLGHLISLRDGLPEQYQSLPDDVLFNGVLEQIIQQTALAQTAEAGLTRRDTLALDNMRSSYLSASVLDAAAEAAVTEDALQKLFDEKFANAAAGTEYNAAHILVPTEDEAKAIKTKLDGGGDFAAIAKEQSQDPGSAQAGGDLGWFGVGMMVEPFETAVVAMTPGQVSDPVQTQFGWHVIRLAETRPAAGPTLDEKRDELAGELQQKAVEALVTDLTAKADIKKMTDGIDPAILKDTSLLDQ
jgi:peptidyl-prolyl cis-trans isomerase C